MLAAGRVLCAALLAAALAAADLSGSGEEPPSSSSGERHMGNFTGARGRSAVADLSGTGEEPPLSSNEERHEGNFTGVRVSDGITLYSNISTHRNGSTLILKSTAEMLQRVRSSVDMFGTLVLSLAPGDEGPDVVAFVTVPGPLSEVNCFARGTVFADVAGGPLIATDHGRITVEEVAFTDSWSVTASSFSSVQVSSGEVGFTSVSVAASSSALLGDVRARSAVLTIVARSSLSGIVLGDAQVTAASNSEVSFVAVQSVGLSCAGSVVNVSGKGHFVIQSEWACQVNRVENPDVDELMFYP